MDVPAGQLKAAEQKVLYERVYNEIGAGGIWRPVFAIERPAK